MITEIISDAFHLIDFYEKTYTHFWFKIIDLTFVLAKLFLELVIWLEIDVSVCFLVLIGGRMMHSC